MIKRRYFQTFENIGTTDMVVKTWAVSTNVEITLSGQKFFLNGEQVQNLRELLADVKVPRHNTLWEDL